MASVIVWLLIREGQRSRSGNYATLHSARRRAGLFDRGGTQPRHTAHCSMLDDVEYWQAQRDGDGDQCKAYPPEGDFAREPKHACAGIKPNSVDGTGDQRQSDDRWAQEAAGEIDGAGHYARYCKIQDNVRAYGLGRNWAAEPVSDDREPRDLRGSAQQTGRCAEECNQRSPRLAAITPARRQQREQERAKQRDGPAYQQWIRFDENPSAERYAGERADRHRPNVALIGMPPGVRNQPDSGHAIDQQQERRGCLRTYRGAGERYENERAAEP